MKFLTLSTHPGQENSLSCLPRAARSEKTTRQPKPEALSEAEERGGGWASSGGSSELPEGLRRSRAPAPGWGLGKSRDARCGSVRIAVTAFDFGAFQNGVI